MSKDEPLRILKQRLAIDLDSLDPWDLYSLTDKLIYDGYVPKVWRTRNGYHIVCQVCIPQNKNSEKLGFWSLLKLRSQYGDDPKRISSDIARITQGFPVDVLFTQKGEYTKFRVPTH